MSSTPNLTYNPDTDSYELILDKSLKIHSDNHIQFSCEEFFTITSDKLLMNYLTEINKRYGITDDFIDECKEKILVYEQERNKLISTQTSYIESLENHIKELEYKIEMLKGS